MEITGARSKLGTVVRVTSGNFIEMFDFFLFGFYALQIGQTFFPSSSAYASLLLTFATFGTGFLMRPLGAVILGSYVDRIGRRNGLILTLAIMATGTALVAFCPGYATIGVAAPLLVLVGRLLQGFSAGVELGGVSVYLAEIATPGHRGFYVSWQSASQQLAIVLAAALGYTLNRQFDAAAIADWAWRIPFFIGCLIVPLVFMLRRSLLETEEFLARHAHPSFAEVVATLATHWRLVGTGMMLIVMTTVSFYLITVYTPTFGRSVLQLSALESLAVTLCIGASNFVWLPLAGAWSDRIGRRPIMAAAALLMLLTAYPALHWLAQAPSYSRMLGVELWLSLLYAGYNGATVVALTELVPARIRTTGFSLAYSLATALFGGFTPLISTWMIERSGDRAAPGWWLTAAAATSLIGIACAGACRSASRA